MLSIQFNLNCKRMNHFYMTNLFSFLLPLYASSCHDKNQPYFTKEDLINDYDFKKLAVREEKKNYFKVMLDRPSKEELILGSRDRLIVINSTTLDIIKEIDWTFPDDYKKCKADYGSSSVCSNYIQLIKTYNNRLIICGTNNLKPRYLILDSEDYSFLKQGRNWEFCSSIDPNFLPVAEITNMGEMISGIYYKKLKGRDPRFTGGAFLYDNTLRRRVEAKESKNPVFVKSFYIGDSVYIFFMEDAQEKNGQRISTVARFCETDNGGLYDLNSIYSREWTTYRKTRLICRYSEKRNNDIHFQDLVDVVFDSSSEMFHTVYTLKSGNINLSMVCTFKLEDIQAAMDSKFLVYNADSKTWQKKENGNFLNGCLVNPSKLSQAANESRRERTPGKQPTDLLKKEYFELAILNKLMSQSVFSQSEYFQFINDGVGFRKILVETLKLPEGLMKIFYVFTAGGNIIMLSKIKDWTCVLRELSTGIINPTIFHIQETKNRLFIANEGTFASLLISNCSIYINESLCLQSQDPRCGWSLKIQKCVTWHERVLNADEKWNNNFKKCPTKQKLVSSWGAWKKQNMEDRKLHCFLRQRACLTCDKNKCNDFEMFQIKNCTTHCKWFWSLWSSWSSCRSLGDHMYMRSRYRECSQKTKCPGHSSETQTCAPFGISWGPWSTCSCVQMVQHRMPLFIENCESCDLLNHADYRICSPVNCSRDLQCISDSTGVPSNCSFADSIKENIANTDEPESTLSKYRNGYFLSLKAFLVIAFALLFACVIMSLLLINIALQHQRKRFLEIS